MKKIVLVAVLLGVVGAFGLGMAVALAQGPVQPPAPGLAPGWMHGGLGLGFDADWHSQMQSAVANALGMTPDDLNAQLRAGKTIAQIAQSKNIDLTKLHDAVQAAHKALIQQAVKDGKLTQAQADAVLQRMNAMDQYWDASGGCPGWTGSTPGPGYGPGWMMRGRGPWTPPASR